MLYSEFSNSINMQYSQYCTSINMLYCNSMQYSQLPRHLQVMMSLPQVESCAVGLFKGLRLVAFVVASPSVHQVAATPLQAELSLSVPGDHEGDWGFLEDLPEDGSRSDAPIRVLHRVVLQQLSLLVPSASIPDSLVLVQALPLTAHG